MAEEKTEIEAIKDRHSVRKYQNRKIDLQKAEIICRKIEEINIKADLHFKFLEDKGDTFDLIFDKAMGLTSAPSVIACMGPDTDDLDEKVGYYGEQLVILAQRIGLNTCWVGTFNRKGASIKVETGDRLAIVIAIGYGATQGSPSRHKTLEQITEKNVDKPYWFNYGAEMVLLAPSAVNQHKLKISYENGKAVFKDLGGLMGKIDLGIARYHFEVGRKYIKDQE